MASGANRIPLGKLILGPSANGESGPSRASLLTTKSSSSMLKPEYVVGEPSSSPGHAPVHGPVRPTTSRFSSAPPPPPPDPVPVPASFPIKQEKPTVEKDRGSRDRSRERDRDRDRDRGKRRDRDSERGARDFDEDRGRRDRDRDGYRERERGGGGGGGDRHFWREKSRDSVSSRDYWEKDRDREREHRGRDRNSRSRYDDNGKRLIFKMYLIYLYLYFNIIQLRASNMNGNLWGTMRIISSSDFLIGSSAVYWSPH